DLVYCDGSGDGGIDIAFLDRGDANDDDAGGTVSGDTWYIVQSKYGKAFQGVNTLLEEGQKVIDTLDGKRQRLSSLAEGLLERLLNFRNNADPARDRLVLVFATEYPLDDPQQRALRDLRSMGRERLGPIFDVETATIDTIYHRTLEDNVVVPERTRVPMRGAMAGSGEDLLVGSVALLDLFDFLKSYREATGDLDQLYERNVRRFLGGRGKVNRAIQETLRTNPERFGLYNNGITIVATDFVPSDDGVTVLVDPYVVNGCQTTRSIWDVCYQRLEAGGHGASPELEGWKERAARGVVVTKIARVGPDGGALEQAITRYTNTQNAIREKDFLALTNDFRTWAHQMGDQYDVYLETQRGGWESRKAIQKQRPELKQFKEYANAFDLLKVYGAGWMREAGTAFGKNAPFLPNGAIFKRIMEPVGGGSEEPYGVEDLYAAYRLQQAADSYRFGRGATHQTRRQTRFLFYMVVLDLLIDVMTRASLETKGRACTRAFLKLFQPEFEGAREELLQSALEVVDTYLTQGMEDSVFAEPAYKNVFNFDLNGFLKWEKLGKSEQDSPRFRSLLAVLKSSMGRSTGGQPSVRQMITQAIAA
ncbi:MAG: AIPR family protein, partial [Chloroflexi bacterium]|nr:AIPR family protein [Chloroflexota bacterium]